MEETEEAVSCYCTRHEQKKMYLASLLFTNTLVFQRQIQRNQQGKEKGREEKWWQLENGLVGAHLSSGEVEAS